MRILCVGDTHANPDWWVRVVAPLAAQLGCDRIIPVGDFGFWRHSSAFLRAVQASPVPVLFCDGNHEHHPNLAAAVAEARARLHIADDTAPVPLGGALSYLPRGGRFTVEGVRFAALGGARSIDRRLRTPGVDWFLEEVVSDADLARLAAGGQADVLICHDTPAGYDIPGLLPTWQLPEVWQSEVPACEEHRRRVREGFEAVEPIVVVHGHYHVRYTQLLDERWGQVRVEGLAADGNGGAFVVLDVADGRVSVVPVAVTLAAA